MLIVHEKADECLKRLYGFEDLLLRSYARLALCIIVRAEIPQPLKSW